MLQRLAVFLFLTLFLIGLMALIAIAWYIALPILVILIGISWIRAMQLRRAWDKLYKQAARQEKQAAKAKKIMDDNIIDVDYEEIKDE